ncbi:unnamed protein product [Closterium sp. NIES-53]
MSGTLGVRGLGVLVPSLTFFALAGAVGRRAGCHTPTQCCFGRLTDALRSQFPDVVELPRWGDLLKQNVAIFDLDFDAILPAMYAVTLSAEGDCYLCVPPDLGIEAAALGASASAAPGTGESAVLGAGESALYGTAPTEALHTFTLDSGASRSFFRDNTTLTQLTRPIAVSLADLSGGPVLAHSSTVLPCPAAPSNLLSGLHLPSFSTNLVSGADLQDAWVDQFTPGGQRVTHCICCQTGHHLATFTRQPRSSLYTLTTASPPVSTSGQVAASGQVFFAASRSSPASPPARVVLCHTRLSFGTMTWSPLPASSSRPAPTCVPCVEGRQRAAPHSSTCPLTEAPLQTLHMDVWGPARVRGQGHERYFLLVVDDYSRNTTVFPLRSKGEGIRQTFTLSASPQQNGIAERHIGMVMDVARTSMIHAAAPHFLWLFAVQYAAHQINLQPRVSLSETTPTLRWTEKVGDPSVFHVWGSRAFVRDNSADKLSSRAVPCVFLGSPPDAHPVEPVEVAVDSGAARGAEPAGAGTGGFEPGVAVSEGAEPGGAEPERVEPGGAEPGGAASGRAEPGAAGGASGAAGGASGAAGGASGAGAATLGAAGAGVVTTGAGDPGAEGTGAVSAVSGGAARSRPYYVPLLQQVLGLSPSTGPIPPLLSPPPVQSQFQLQPVSPLPGPSHYSRLTRGLTERRKRESCPLSPESRPTSPESRSETPVRAVCTGRRVSRLRPPTVPGTHSMTLRPSTAPHRVPPPSPPASFLPDGPGPKSDSLCAASPTVMCFLATAVTDPLFESTAASALFAELVDFAATCRLDYATSLVAESASACVCPPPVGGECALGTDVLEDIQEEFECFYAAVPHLVSMLLAPEGDPDAPDIPTPRSYAEAIEGTYVDEVPPPGANIVSGMWIFRVKRPPGSPPVFKARYVARGFIQRQGVDFFQTFSPTPKMTTLRHSLPTGQPARGDLAAPPTWLHWVVSSWYPVESRRPVYGLRQAPREWHDTLRTTLAALGFAPSTADPSLFLHTLARKRFYTMERNYGDGEIIVQYLQRVDEYVSAIEELKYKVDENEIIYTALQGLDQEANEALLQYLHLEQQKWTKAWIWEVLVSDEARKRDAGRGIEGGMGAGDRAASKKYRQRQGGGGKKKELDKCLVPGCNRKHSWKECWIRPDGWKPQGYPGEASPVTRSEWVERRMKNGAWNKKGSKEKAAAAAGNRDKKGKEDSSNDVFSFLSLEKETALAGRVLADPNQLILDSGATCGMVPRRDLFTTYHSLPPNSRNVIVGSGDTLQAIGIGTITGRRRKRNDGKNKVRGKK